MRSAYREPNVRIVITDRMSTRSRSRAALLALALAAPMFGAIGCGGGDEGGGEPPDYARVLAGSPPPLAALHAEGGELLPGGLDAYERRLAKLDGYPVVVNLWGSWCGPCRAEFPLLQNAAARFGKRVAFLGVDSQDSEEAAAAFLRDNPVPYPSYSDPDEEIAAALGATRGYPDTAFYDRGGDLVYLKQGPYTDDAQLENDIHRYALGKGG